MINGLDLSKFNARMIEQPIIYPAEVERSFYETSVGDLIKTKERIRPNRMEFSVEFKGERRDIEYHKSRFASEIKECRIVLDDDFYYEGYFDIESIEESYVGFEVVRVTGICWKYKNLVINIPLKKGKNTVVSKGNIKVTGLLTIRANSSGSCTIEGLTKSPIGIPSLTVGSEYLIGLDHGVKKIEKDGKTAIDEIEILEFPKVDAVNEIILSGTGDVTAELSYQAQVF